MSAKKKKVVSECAGCHCHILTKDADRHRDVCGKEVSESPIQLISPNNILIGTTAIPDKLEGTPQSFGWSRFETTLVAKESLSTFGVLPRAPAFVQVDGGPVRVMCLWPNDQLPHMRVAFPNSPSEKRITIRPVTTTVPSDKLTLLPIDVDEAIIEKPAFIKYLQIYLSNAFLAEGSEVSVNYYGKRYVFNVPSSLEDALDSLSLNDKEKAFPKVLRLPAAPKIFITRRQVNAKEKKLTGFGRIGGSDKAKLELATFLINPIKKKSLPCSVIIWGLTGTGKSLILDALTDILPAQHILLRTAADLQTQIASIGFAKDKVLLIDNFETIKPDSKTADSTLDLLCEVLDEKRFLAVVVVARSIESIDLRLRRRFPVEVELTVPSPDERKDILKLLLIAEGRNGVPDEVVEETTRESHGFTGADLEGLVKLSGHMLTEANKDVAEVFRQARSRIRPTGLRQFVLEVPNVSWDDIAGMTSLKREIEQAIIWPFKHPEAFSRLGVEPPTGILLYGPPGCSKTLVARALAAQSKLNFLSVKGPQLFSKWVGESERAVRELFHRARQVSPAILFFDEIDAVAGKRGGDSSSGVSDRVLAQLLTELDGLEKNTGVIVLAATNRPETIDGAILRPGRLDRSIYVPLPEAETRTAIIGLQMRKMTMSAASLAYANTVAEKTESYSGAEVVAVCKTAALLAMRDNMDAAEVLPEHFDRALEVILPRTDKKTLHGYERFAKGLPNC